MSDGLEITRDERSATIWFNRPAKRNALDRDTSFALGAALDELAGTPLPVVLRSRTPGMFVAGTDVASLRARSLDDSLDRLNVRLFQRVADHPTPTIAAVEGWALGGGCELALACDLRLSTHDAQWGLPEVRLGIVPGAGGLSRLSTLIGRSRATELVLTGRRIDGAEAHRIGLVQRVTDADSVGALVDEVVDDLAAATPLALRLAKEALGVTGDPGRLVDATAQALCITSEEAQDRLAALATRQLKR